MPQTRDFTGAIRARAQRDASFRVALLREAADCLLAGDLETGRAVLRDYVHATVGFEELARATAKSPKSLMRMLSSGGNPQLANFLAILSYLQKQANVRLETVAHDRK